MIEQQNKTLRPPTQSRPRPRCGGQPSIQHSPATANAMDGLCCLEGIGYCGQYVKGGQMKRLVLVVILCLVTISWSCGPQPTSTPVAVAKATVRATRTAGPTSTSRPTVAPANTAEPTVTAVAFVSGGLGLSRKDWEREQGTARMVAGMYEYEDGKYTVAFANDSVQFIDYRLGVAVTLEDARDIGGTLLPADRLFVESYSPEGLAELVVDVYVSESLAETFASQGGELDWWFGSVPGTFIAIYGVYDKAVTGIVISTGNKP